MERSPPSPLPEKKMERSPPFSGSSPLLSFATPKIYFTYVVKSKNQRLPQDIEEKECKLQSRTQGTEQEYLSPQYILFQDICFHPQDILLTAYLIHIECLGSLLIISCKKNHNLKKYFVREIFCWTDKHKKQPILQCNVVIRHLGLTKKHFI